jgi:uncharacterized coiled-coil DUF342 family protein
MSESSEFRVQRRFIKSPDTKARDDALAKLNAEIKQKDSLLNEIKAQIAKAVTDPKVSAERKTLIEELKELRKTQSDLKGKRTVINSKIKETDAAMKRKITEIQSVTSKYNFKSVVDIDNKVKSAEDEIASGSLALVDERRLVKEISNLRKLRKDFAGLEAQQKAIDADKQKITDLKKELSTVNAREISDKFESVQKTLDELSLSNKAVNDKRDALFKKRNALQAEKDVLYASIKKTREEFDQQFKTFKKALDDEKKRVVEEEKKLKADKSKSERKAKLEAELAEASQPAFEYEIDTIHALLTYFDPSYVKPVEEFGFNSTAASEKKGRVIEAADDYEIIKKDDEVFFAGSKSKNKKGKKNNKKFTLEPDVISQLGDLDIILPTSKDQVPAVIEALKTKLDNFTSIQKETTEKNIESAKAKIAKLEAEWAKQDAKEAEAAAAAESAESVATADEE